MNFDLSYITDIDFLMKYGLIIMNFFIIFTLFAAKMFFKTNHEQEGPKKNLLFLIAHPDDESMFFVPTIVELRKNYFLHLLCLSNGDADGLGGTREKELEKAANFLGFSSLEITKDDLLLDGFNQKWDPEAISEHISQIVKKREISAIITFDESGVSSHPNHIATYHGTLYPSLA